jgi:hypothetical protein
MNAARTVLRVKASSSAGENPNEAAIPYLAVTVGTQSLSLPSELATYSASKL